MKTAISMPEGLFRRAEELARKLGKSRSELYREALAEYLLRRDPDAITRAMDEVCSEVDTRPDPWLREVSRRTLERDEW